MKGRQGGETRGTFHLSPLGGGESRKWKVEEGKAESEGDRGDVSPVSFGRRRK
jgi:hypothetical protein